jgi:hypothetical protein
VPPSSGRLDDLLDALEPSLVAIAGGVSSISGKVHVERRIDDGEQHQRQGAEGRRRRKP